MGRVYTISFSAVAVAAQQDFFSLKPADDKPIKLISCRLSNVGIVADRGDAKEQFWGVEIARGNTTIGSGGSNPDVMLLDSADGDTGITANARANDTTKVSGGTRSLLVADGFNSRVGWLYQPTPEEMPTCREGDGYIAVQLVTTPDEAITMSGTLTFEEI